MHFLPDEITKIGAKFPSVAIEIPAVRCFPASLIATLVLALRPDDDAYNRIFFRTSPGLLYHRSWRCVWDRFAVLDTVPRLFQNRPQAGYMWFVLGLKTSSRDILRNSECELSMTCSEISYRVGGRDTPFQNLATITANLRKHRGNSLIVNRKTRSAQMRTLSATSSSCGVDINAERPQHNV